MERPPAKAVLLEHSQRLSHPAYRPDIDGLRAVAVLAVVLFHAFPGTVRGGFIGVDIFFVISGFLISTILFGNLSRNTFSFVEFYVRRVRRIFPALVVVLLTTFTVGWFTLMGDEYEQLGKHLAAGAGFVSNLVFWRESGYFDTAADAKPLLHLWSLGIEEQFYIVWPLILFAAWRLRMRLLTLTVGAVLLSFAVNATLAETDPIADFYSPYSRFWELSLGSTLAYLTVFEKRWIGTSRPHWRDLQSVVGALLLVVGFVLIERTSAFPGWWALLPTFGALLLIAAGSQAWINRRILANRLMVGIGLISFPLYLWHWPILSFIRVLDAERPTRLTRLIAVGIALLLAWLTYRWIEIPIRRTGRSRWILGSLLVTMTLMAAIGFACFRNGGFPFRAAASPAVVNPGDIGHEAFYEDASARFPLCGPMQMRSEAERWNDTIRCLQSREGPVDLAIIGDSHAEHLFVGLAEALPRINVVFYSRGASPTVRSPEFDHVFSTVVGDAHIKAVVLSAWWTLRFAETPRGTSPLQSLQATIDVLLAAGKRVYLADDVPNFSFSPRLCKFESGIFRINKCQDDVQFYGKQLASYRDLFQTLAKRNPNVEILEISRYFCDRSDCSMVRDKRLMFRDSDHLNTDGSRYVGRRIAEDYPDLREMQPGR